MHEKNRDTSEQSEESSLGLRLKSKVNAIDYRVEVIKQNTNNKVSTNTEGEQFDVEVGYTLADLKNLRIGAEWFKASKDFDQGYPLAHAYLGIVDVLGRRNVEGYAGHLSLKPLDELNIVFDYHKFKRGNTGAEAYSTGQVAYSPEATSNTDDLGSEMDLVFKYTPVKNSIIFLGGGIFKAGKYFKDAHHRNDDDVKFAFLQYLVKF